jgi:hypothetical protein
LIDASRGKPVYSRRKIDAKRVERGGFSTKAAATWSPTDAIRAKDDAIRAKDDAIRAKDDASTRSVTREWP